MRSKVLKPIGVFLLILALFAAVIIVIVQTSFFRQFVKITTNSIVSTLTNQDFTIGGIEGNFLRGITLKNVSFQIGDEHFIDCDEVYIDYSLPIILDGSMIFSKVIPLREVSVRGLRINLVRTPDGVWNFEKLGDMTVKEKRENPDWNILIQDSTIIDAKMSIDDRFKGERSELELPRADLSLRMYKIADRAELDLKSANLTVALQGMDFEKLYFNDISGKASYSNKGIMDRLDVKRLIFRFMNAGVSATGSLIDLMNPRFNLNGRINRIELPDLGVLNVEVEAEGESRKWEELKASGKLRLVNSVFMGQELRGTVDSVKVDNTDVELKEGKLSTDFGSASFEGSLALEEMTDPAENNTLDLHVLLHSLQLSPVLETLAKNGDGETEEPNNTIDALVDSDFDIHGSWSKSSDFTTGLDIHEMNIASSEAGGIKLSGPAFITTSKVDYEFDTTFLKTNFAPLLNDDRYASDFNSSLHLKGTIGTGEDILDGFQISARGEIGPSRILNTNLKEAKLDVSYTGAYLDIKTLFIDSDPLIVKASGDIGTSRGSGVEYDITVNDLGILSEFSDDLDMTGSLGLKGSLRGDLKNPRLSVSATGSDFVYEKQKFKAKKIDLSGESYIDLDNPRLNVRGGLKGVEIQDRKIQIADFKAKSRGSEIDGTFDIQETTQRRYSVDLKLTEISEKETKLELPRVVINLRNEVLKNRRPIYITLLEDSLTIDSFNLYHKENFVVGDLNLGYDESIEGTIKLEKLRLLDASELLNVRFPVKGQVSGEISLGNTLKQPDINAGIVAKDLEYMKFKSDELNLSLLYSQNKLSLNLNITDNSEEILSAVAEATIPLDLENMDRSFKQSSYKATIKSGGIDISPLIAFNAEIQDIDGKLLIDMVAEGTGQDPNVSGKLELKDLSLDVLALRNKITIDHAVMDMDGKFGVLRPVTIKTGEGEGVFEGRVDFRDLSYTGNGIMKNMLMEAYPDDVRANLDGKIEVEGKFLNALITGDLTANNMEAVVPEKPVKYIENIKFVDDSGIEQEEFIFTGEKAEDYVEEYIALALTVDIPKDSWVKGSGANIEVEGKIDINKNYKEPYVVTGNIDAIRGDYQFMGKLFKVESGTVSFRGKKIINPFLDLRAIYEVSSVEVYINITGTAEKPGIQLSSDPPLDENEIVSYLVFGTSSDKLGTDERIEFQEKAGEVLGTMALGELREAFGEEFAIDVMTIKGGQTGFRDTHFEVGKYLTEDLYVGYERLSYERFFYERYFFSPGISSSTVTANRAVIEYRVFDFMTLESEIGDEAGADVFFNFDY